MTKPVYAIFGGTFDPPHYGHLRPLQECADLLNLPSIALMPANVSVFKSNVTASEHRIEMTKRLCDLDPRFTLELIEFDRQETSYTYESLKKVKERYPDHSVVFIMGLDSFQHIHKWHKWEAIFDYAHIVVMARMTDTLSESELASNLYDIYTNHEHFDRLVGAKMDEKSRLMLLSKLALAESGPTSVNQSTFMDIISTSAQGKLWFINNKLVPFASTDIRAKISAGVEPTNELPKSIIKYINQNRLYR